MADPPLHRVVRQATARLDRAGVETPDRDARLLVADALSVDRAGLTRERDRLVTAGERARIAALIDRRAAREPVSRILGRREFWSLDFALGPATLDPRPDSETLVEAALRRFTEPDARMSVLDIGTGTGCLLLAFLHERRRATGVGVDIDESALAVARTNAGRLALGDRARFVRSSWGEGLAGGFDLVLSNPPYVAAADWAGLAPEVRGFDPVRALVAGADGLDAYRAIARRLAGLLAPDGLAVIELGIGQAEPVEAIFRKEGLAAVGRKRDLAGIERALLLHRTQRKGQR